MPCLITSTVEQTFCVSTQSTLFLYTGNNSLPLEPPWKPSQFLEFSFTTSEKDFTSSSSLSARAQWLGSYSENNNLLPFPLTTVSAFKCFLRDREGYVCTAPNNIHTNGTNTYCINAKIGNLPLQSTSQTHPGYQKPPPALRWSQLATNPHESMTDDNNAPPTLKLSRPNQTKPNLTQPNQNKPY